MTSPLHTSECPDRAMLDRCFAGALRAEEIRAIIDHLASCETCRQHRATAEAQERLLAEIRALADAGVILTRGIRSTVAAAVPPDWPRIEGLRLIRLIGEGGMGIVYEAEQELPARRVAVKVLKQTPGGACSRGRVFFREVEALGRLRHPDIAVIHAAGTCEDGQPYIMMELVPGLRLDEYLREAGVPIREQMRLLARVCLAVHHAHTQGVIHLDLKPSNIIVSAAGEPKVLDFGLAKLTGRCEITGESMVRDAEVAGTAGFMSPEQCLGNEKHIDARSDVFSLAVLAHRCLRAPSAPDKAAATAWEGLQAVLERAQSADPAQRPSSAGELADSFQAAASGLTDKRKVRSKAPILLLVILAACAVGVAGFLVRGQSGGPRVPGVRSGAPTAGSGAEAVKVQPGSPVVLGMGLVVSDLAEAERIGSDLLARGDTDVRSEGHHLAVYAMILDERGQAEAAERAMRLACAANRPGAALAADQARLARVIARQGRGEEVQALLSAAATGDSSDRGRWSEVIASESAAARARLHRHAERWPDAETELLNAFEAFSGEPSRPRQFAAQAFIAGELAKTYRAWGRSDLSAEWHGKAARFQSQVLPDRKRQ